MSCATELASKTRTFGSKREKILALDYGNHNKNRNECAGVWRAERTLTDRADPSHLGKQPNCVST